MLVSLTYMMHRFNLETFHLVFLTIYRILLAT